MYSEPNPYLEDFTERTRLGVQLVSMRVLKIYGPTVAGFFLETHCLGNWGEASDEQNAQNEVNVATGETVTSWFSHKGRRVVVETASGWKTAARSITNVFDAKEYEAQAR